MVDLVHAGEEDEDVTGRLDGVQLKDGVHAALDIVGARLLGVEHVHGVVGPLHRQDGRLLPPTLFTVGVGVVEKVPGEGSLRSVWMGPDKLLNSCIHFSHDQEREDQEGIKCL